MLAPPLLNSGLLMNPPRPPTVPAPLPTPTPAPAPPPPGVDIGPTANSLSTLRSFAPRLHHSPMSATLGGSIIVKNARAVSSPHDAFSATPKRPPAVSVDFGRLC
jgi:hypothetical protein